MKNRHPGASISIVATAVLSLVLPACSSAATSNPVMSSTVPLSVTPTQTQETFISSPTDVVVVPDQSVEVLLTVNGYQLVPTILRAYGGQPGEKPAQGYAWSKPAGAEFPPGISVDKEGRVTYSGNSPVQPGNFMIEASDGARKGVSKITVAIEDFLGGPAPHFSLIQSASELPAGKSGNPYGATISVFGGTPPYAFTVDQTGLSKPDYFTESGLRLDAKTGVILGIISPKVAGKTLEVRVLATDAAGITDTHALTYAIHVLP